MRDISVDGWRDGDTPGVENSVSKYTFDSDNTRMSLEKEHHKYE